MDLSLSWHTILLPFPPIHRHSASLFMRRFLLCAALLIGGGDVAYAPAVAATVDREKDVPPYSLPDPLIRTNGQPVRTAREWRESRRPELLRLFADEEYGRTLVGRPSDLKFVVRESVPNARGGRATRLRIGVLFEGREEGRQMELLVYLPNEVKGPVPVFLGLNFDGNYTTTAEPDLPVPRHWVMGLFGNPTADHRPLAASRGIHQHQFPYAYALEHGYGIVTAGYGEIEPDLPGHWRDGPRGLGPEPGPQDWGCLGAWAWGLSRSMDYLETNPRIDSRRVAVMGFSRLGKAAVWAAAQDERFALVVSQNSGAGGVALSKRLFGEDVAHLAGPLGHWFAPAFARYAGNEAALPIDQHELVALLAPRPVLILSATEDSYSDPKGEFLGGLGADPVYRMLKAGGLNTRTWPPPSELVSGSIGYFLRPGGHDVTLEDWQAMIAFTDQKLRAVPHKAHVP